MMLSAVVTATNTIDVTFNEAVQTSIPTENLRVIRSGTSGLTARPITVTSILVSARTVRIRLGEDWDPSRCYYVQANGVTDARGIAIAADSVIGVVMPGNASACPVPSDPPLDQLRLSIHGDANGTRISWPPGYHGFALVSTYDYAGNGPVIWRPTTNQTNGGLVPPGPNRVFQLRKYP